MWHILVAGQLPAEWHGLLREDYEVVWATTEREAVRTVMYDGPFAVIVDALGNGTTSLWTRLQRFCETPVIVVTPNGSIPDCIRCLKTGIADYVATPCDGRMLAWKLRRVISAD